MDSDPESRPEPPQILKRLRRGPTTTPTTKTRAVDDDIEDFSSEDDFLKEHIIEQQVEFGESTHVGLKLFLLQHSHSALIMSQKLGAQHRRTTMKPVGVLENFRQNPEGFVYKGKEMMSGFQNLNPDFSWGRNSGIEKDSDGAVVTSVIKGAACSCGYISPTLDISLRVERGNDGQWQVIFSKVVEVGPATVKLGGNNKLHNFKIVLTKGSGLRPHAAWKPKAQAGLHNVLPFKPKSLRVSSKPTFFKSGETQSSVASPKLSFPACNTDAQLRESSFQPSVSVCHVSGIRSSISTCANSSSACESPLSVPLQVVPGLGSSSSAAPSVFGLPQMISSKSLVLPSVQKVGSRLPTRDEVGMVLEEGNFETDSARTSQ
nr:hypothetical protein CFP56_66935 [Quercus suber]